MKNRSISSRRLWYRLIASFICNWILNSIISKNVSAKTINKNGDNTYGWMYPEGERIISVGQYLEIFCTIDSTIAQTANVTSSNLEFQKDRIPLNSPNVTKVNERTIRLYLLISDQWYHKYECFLKAKKVRRSRATLPKNRLSNLKENSLDYHTDDPKFTISQDSTYIHGPLTPIGSLNVIVGEKPENVINFQCKSSLNYNKLCCSWNTSVSSAKTTYTIQRIMQSDFVTFEELGVCNNGGMYMYMYQCCWLDIAAHIKRGYFNFKITRENIFGKRQQILNLDRFKLKVKPSFYFVSNSPPLGVGMSILTMWKLPWDESLNYDEQPVNMTFELCLRNYHQLVMNWSCGRYLHEINVRGKDFFGSTKFPSLLPNSVYEFRIRCKFSDAPQYEEYWSDYTIESGKTDLLLRKTSIGLFHIIHRSNEGKRSISTLWIPRAYYNLNGAHIDIFEVDETNNTEIIDLKKLALEDPFRDGTVTFDVGPSAYHIALTSRYKDLKSTFNYNQYEYSIESTSINVPASNNEVELLCALFYVVQHANNTYEYIWQPPEKQLNIFNYTLFWRTRPDSYMVSNWTYVLTNQSEIPFNFGPCTNNVSIPYENNWKFYISANTEKYSSSLQQSVELVSSVTDFWKSKRFLELQQKWVSTILYSLIKWSDYLVSYRAHFYLKISMEVF